MDIVTEKYISFHSQNSHHLVQNPLLSITYGAWPETALSPAAESRLQARYRPGWSGAVMYGSYPLSGAGSPDFRTALLRVVGWTGTERAEEPDFEISLFRVEGFSIVINDLV